MFKNNFKQNYFLIDLPDNIKKVNVFVYKYATRINVFKQMSQLTKLILNQIGKINKLL